VGHRVARQGVTREQANEIAKQILAEYEAQMQEYLDLYERCKEKLSGFGLDYSLL